VSKYTVQYIAIYRFEGKKTTTLFIDCSCVYISIRI